MKEDDLGLLELIGKGDEAALKKLFNRYFVQLCRYINIYVDSHSDSEDIALDIFIYLWENRNTLSINSSPKAYLFRSARNRSLNHLRDQVKTVSLATVSESIIEPDENSLEFQELDRLIVEAVSSLPDKCREVFIKSRDEGMSNKAIAEDMQISVKTVEAQITKALKIIRRQVAPVIAHLIFL